jgi:hypothetical protein
MLSANDFSEASFFFEALNSVDSESKMSGLAELRERQSLESPAHVVAAEMFCTF